jgi:hypothetical protein
MSKGDQKGTNKIRSKPAARTSRPADKAKAGAAGDQPENKLKAERPKPKAVPPVNKSDPDSYRDENPKSEIKHPASEIENPKSEIPNPTSEIIEQLPTANSKLQTEPMEVHHHPQLDHNPKPFKEYLLEGFMIFIAVMMGFIAENIRETINNNEHVKQLTSQLAQDLKADTAQLNGQYQGETKMVRDNDTLFNLLQQPLQKADTRRIQQLVENSHSMWLFHPSTGAMNAIKNELHLKQFSNSKIISYFSKFEGHIELLHLAQDINLQYQRIYLDPFLTRHFTPANMAAAFENPSALTGQMRNLTQDDLDQLAADMVLIRVITKEMVRDNVELKKDAVEMLRYVTRQYHLEDE